MEQENVTFLSYGSEKDTPSYTINTLGEDFEVDIPPENIAIAVCVHHRAVEIQKENPESNVKIVTVGGCAETNKRIVERINEITDTHVEVEADVDSYSTATNIESLKEYHLKENGYEVIDWESYANKTELSERERKILSEVTPLLSIPIQRKISEAILVVFALIDPQGGLTKRIASKRKNEREKDPKKNIFKRNGLS